MQYNYGFDIEYDDDADNVFMMVHRCHDEVIVFSSYPRTSVKSRVGLFAKNASASVSNQRSTMASVGLCHACV